MRTMHKSSHSRDSASVSNRFLTMEFGCVLAVMALTGCTRKDGPCEIVQARPLLRYHRAVAGETLADIARRYDMSVQELCRLNNFTTTFALVPGQKVFVIPPKDNSSVVGTRRVPSITVETTPSGFASEEQENLTNDATTEDETADSLNQTEISPAPEKGPHLIWPVKGRLLRRFKDVLPNGTLSDGINISAPLNTPVRAIANGTVMDAGELVLGFGKMILILHDDGLLSIYSHLQEIDVRKGDTVSTAQVIGRVGKRAMFAFLSCTSNCAIPQKIYWIL